MICSISVFDALQLITDPFDSDLIQTVLPSEVCVGLISHHAPLLTALSKPVLKDPQTQQCEECLFLQARERSGTMDKVDRQKAGVFPGPGRRVLALEKRRIGLVLRLIPGGSLGLF